MHKAGRGLFEEIEILRNYLRVAFCVHGVPLCFPCEVSGCMNNPAREELKKLAGARAMEILGTTLAPLPKATEGDSRG